MALIGIEQWLDRFGAQLRRAEAPPARLTFTIIGRRRIPDRRAARDQASAGAATTIVTAPERRCGPRRREPNRAAAK
jgi:hypothetical protein